MSAVAESPRRGRKSPAPSAEPPQSKILVEWPYRFEVVDVQELQIDADYQRPLTSFWKTVFDDFNPALVGTLVVSERSNGRKLVIDGQTRMTAMREAGHTHVPCLIFSGLSKAQEAQLFSDLQTKRRGMRTYDRFRAQLVAKNPDALEIARITTDVGFVLGVDEDPGTLLAIAALEKAYKIAPEHLEQVLQIIRDVWGTQDRDAVSAQIITGLSTFIRTQDKIDYDRLKKRLVNVTPRLIINKASQIREGAGWGTGAGKSVAQAILAEYLRKR